MFCATSFRVSMVTEEGLREISERGLRRSRECEAPHERRGRNDGLLKTSDLYVNRFKKGSGPSGLKLWLRVHDAAGVVARWF
jgi:hypothetical protein